VVLEVNFDRNFFIEMLRGLAGEGGHVRLSDPRRFKLRPEGYEQEHGKVCDPDVAESARGMSREEVTVQELFAIEFCIFLMISRCSSRRECGHLFGVFSQFTGTMFFSH
jgi:hypothetical protein